MGYDAVSIGKYEKGCSLLEVMDTEDGDSKVY
jgi:hypothetical protein